MEIGTRSSRLYLSCVFLLVLGTVIWATVTNRLGAAVQPVSVPRVAVATSTETHDNNGPKSRYRKDVSPHTASTRAMLSGPSFSDPQLFSLNAVGVVKSRAKTPLVALAYHYRTDIFGAARRNARAIGYARRGTRLPVEQRVYGNGCKGGAWYKVASGGYVCTKRGFVVARKPKRLTLHYNLPARSRPLPYRYAAVTDPKAMRYYRIPTVAEDKLIKQAEQGQRKRPDVVERQMEGVFFLAIDGPQKSAGREFLRTVYGRYVRQSDLKWLPPSPMHGERLRPKVQLPLAFVFDEDQPVYRFAGNRLEARGFAERHARFSVRREIAHKKRRFVMDRRGNLLDRSAVRVAQAVKRPIKVGRKEKWIHVNLREQTLVAYRGDRPVFATLVSSGKKGYVPPTGMFRIVKKHVSVTMSGSDPVEGWYEVEEVPWTMYYWEGYALHGAYWHSDFGRARSHGCTNIAPVDARWLFHWTEPKVPQKWQGLIDKGTWVRFSA